MLHLAILRSPMAHAKIVSIDTDRGQGAPRRRRACSPARTSPRPRATCRARGRSPRTWSTPAHPSLAVDPGQPRRRGRRGRRRAQPRPRRRTRSRRSTSSTTSCPPVLDMEAGDRRRRDARAPRTRRPTSPTSGRSSPARPAPASRSTRRSRDAEVTVTRRFIQQRLIPAFMEPRSTVVQPTAEGMTMWSATQIPHILRIMLALTLGIPEHKIRVIAPDVGGGFGGKIPVTPEEIISVLVARKLGKPVKYTESRSESLMSAHHGRDQIQDITITAKRDGTVTGLDVHLLADMGAYLRLVGPGVPILGAFMYNAIYKIPALRFVCEGIFTTKTPTDAYRGAGRPEATFAIERIMDELAVELGMDPMELRRKNWIKHEEFPFTTVVRADLRQRQLRGRHRQGARPDRLGRAARRAGRAAGAATTRSSWAWASRRSPRCAASRPRACWARWPTAPAAGSTRPCGCCPPARSRWSPARARTGRATRRRSARSSPTGSASRSRTSRSCTATPPCRTRAWTPTVRARSRSAASPSSRPPTR